MIVTSQFGERLVNVFGYGKERDASYLSDEELLQQLIQRRKKEIEEPAKVGEPAKTDSGPAEAPGTTPAAK